MLNGSQALFGRAGGVGEGTGQQINKVNKVSREKKKLRFHMIVKRLRVSLKTCSCSTSV